MPDEPLATPPSSSTTLTLPLTGPGGEPVDFWCTVRSHGVAGLSPATIDPVRRDYRTAVTIPGIGPRAVTLHEGCPGVVQVTVGGSALDASATASVATLAHRMLALDLDFSAFYAQCTSDPDLAWAARGAGRMLRGPSVFEDVVKTICTTNCTWAATVRMTTALVRHLGVPIPGMNPEDASGRAFPTPAAMAAVPEAFYRETIRAGYRGRYLLALAEGVASGTIDLESLATATATELPDDELATHLLALPGVGPYAAAHIMLLRGRFSRLILDSWTQPTFARLERERGVSALRASGGAGGAGSSLVPDREIVARFSPYGEFAGLAFWLFVTRDWHEKPETHPAPSPVTEPTG